MKKPGIYYLLEQERNIKSILSQLLSTSTSFVLTVQAHSPRKPQSTALMYLAIWGFLLHYTEKSFRSIRFCL